MLHYTLAVRPKYRHAHPIPGGSSESSVVQGQHQLVRNVFRPATGYSVVQPKLRVGAPNDKYEQEADRVAEQVMRMPEPQSSSLRDDSLPVNGVSSYSGTIQRVCAPCAEEYEAADGQNRPVDSASLCPKCRAREEGVMQVGQTASLLQRQEATEEEEELIQAKISGDATSEVAPGVQGKINGLRGGGRPLPALVRAFFESRFERNFGAVRVHADTGSAQAAQAVNARAFTVGSDIVFGSGQFNPATDDGRRLLAHELAHVVQQSGGGQGVTAQPRPLLARQCNPGWAMLPWGDRVRNAKAMPNGAAKYECLKDMIDEALYANVTVLQKTNNSPSVSAAIGAGRYDEWGGLSDVQVNYDHKLNAKVANVYGQTSFRQPTPDDIEIYIILGPAALNEIGPQFTRMAYDHESEHAGDFLLQFGLASETPHAATAGEELVIYAAGFSSYFLNMWTIDNTACGFGFAEDFRPLFTYYPSATSAKQDEAFDSIAMFFDVRIKGIPCNEMKFKIWLQGIMNARPAGDALVARINALPGLGLTRRTNPATHFDCTLGCS